MHDARDSMLLLALHELVIDGSDLTLPLCVTDNGKGCPRSVHTL